MKNKKQTAVAYLQNCIDKYLAYSVEGSHKAEQFTITDLLKAFEQAKAMQKEQIMFDYSMGAKDAIFDYNKIDCHKHYFENYA